MSLSAPDLASRVVRKGRKTASSDANDPPSQGAVPWKTEAHSAKWRPRHNICPKTEVPVLLASPDGKGGRELALFHWGLIPAWHKGASVRDFKLNMINARSDTLLDKASFRIPLQKGQRCVVVVEGFYEWHDPTSKQQHGQEADAGQAAAPSGKQPYYVTMMDGAEGEGSVCSGGASTAPDEVNCGGGSSGSHGGGGGGGGSAAASGPSAGSGRQQPQRLMFMAGLYDEWIVPGSGSGPEKEVHRSCTIVTVAASKTFEWLHHRQPAVLMSDDAVDAWLSPSTTLSGALQLITAADALKWHPVSKDIGKISAEGANLIAEVSIIPTPKRKNKSAAMMSAWLEKSPSTATRVPATERAAAAAAASAPVSATRTATGKAAASAVPTTQVPEPDARSPAQVPPTPPSTFKRMRPPMEDGSRPTKKECASSNSGSNSGSGGSGKRSWSCAACTFENDNPLGLACAVCGTLRVT